MKKSAEPPPPKGVSTKDWDKMLQQDEKLVGRIRKIAEQLKGAQDFHELTSEPGPTAYELIYESKIAAAADPELLVIAARLESDPDQVFEVYEAMGGTYKHAFGAPMFSSPSGGAPTGGAPRISAGKTMAVGTTPKTTAGGGVSAPTVQTPSSGTAGA